MSDNSIPLIRPTLAPWETVEGVFRAIYESGDLTTGKMTARFEEEVARRIGVANVVALSSCTSGLMLVMRALDLRGEIVMPAFTWTSTGLAALWNGLTPVFADVLPETGTMDPQSLSRVLGPKTAAVMAVNVFGVYPDMDDIAAICREARVPFLCDSAQGLGATYRGRMSGGLADAEIFSLSPTKVVTAVEGGLVTTGDANLAEKIRRMRDYGKSRDAMDIEYIGLSARVSEFHAAVGLANLEHMDALIETRRGLFARYRKNLDGIEGCSCQRIPEDRTTTGNYFVLFLDSEQYDREVVVEKLAARGVATKRYFFPPLHRQKAFAGLPPLRIPLPVTERLSTSGLALPLFTHMSMETVDRVSEILINELRRCRVAG